MKAICYLGKSSYNEVSALPATRGGLCEWLKQAVLKTGLPYPVLRGINHLARTSPPYSGSEWAFGAHLCNQHATSMQLHTRSVTDLDHRTERPSQRLTSWASASTCGLRPPPSRMVFRIPAALSLLIIPLSMGLLGILGWLSMWLS